MGRIARCLSIASSDSGGGAGIAADLRAFAAAGCHGAIAIVALTAQNTREVSAVHELPAPFILAQLHAVADDIGIDAAKTGMLASAAIIATVADFLEGRGLTLVVDPVLVASSGARLLPESALSTMVSRLLPLATVLTPNLPEAEALAGGTGSRRQLAERLYDLGAAAVIVTGGHGDEPVDHLFDGRRHVAIAVDRHRVAATHGAGCTHSATLTALLGQGWPLEDAARAAAATSSAAVANGLVEIGGGDGPVDALDIRARVRPWSPGSTSAASTWAARSASVTAAEARP